MSHPPPLDIHIDSTPGAIKQVRTDIERYCVLCGLNEKAAQDVGLCVNEALANIIRHAYAGSEDQPIHVSAAAVAHGVEVRIRDWGNGFDPSDVVRDRVAEPLRIGGLGLICLRSLTDELKYEPQHPGMLLTLVKRGEREVPRSLKIM